MASSGSITTGQKEGRSVTLSWTLSSQNIANNTSTIAWTLKGSGSASGWVMSGGFKAVINGTTVYSSSTDNRIQLKNGTVVASGSLTIAHNSDGTKSFNLSCEAGVYTYAVSVSASGTHTLNTIPITICMTGDSVKVTETNLLLHFVSHTEMLTAYSEELFESYADHIEIIGRNEIKFVMKCGLTFTERIGD